MRLTTVEPPAIPRNVLSFDIVGSTPGGNLRHWRQLATMRLALDHAIARCRLVVEQPRGWDRRTDGDSELVLAPPGMPKSAVLTELLPAVRNALLRLNFSQKPEFEVRLRVGVDHGDVTLLEGLPAAGGEVLATAVTLRDAEALKASMHTIPAAVLGVAISDEFHRAAVLHGDPVLYRGDFRRVLVPGKYADRYAWIYLLGASVAPVGAQPVSATSPASPASAQSRHKAPVRWRTVRRSRPTQRRERQLGHDRAAGRPPGRPRGAAGPDHNDPS